MTATPPETTARVNWLRRARYALLAALLGTIAGFAGVYLTGGLQRNAGLGTDASCVNAALTSKRLMPLAKGEVAAFQANERPRAATPISFLNASGQAVDLTKLRGKVVLVNLWATWCLPCRKEMPALDELQAKLGGKDFEVVAINLDTREREKPKAFLAAIGIKHLAYYEDPKAEVFQKLKAVERAPGLPSTLLIDRNGCELGFVLGPAEWASEEALSLIRTAIAGN
ncbi:MAG: TlpA family protein disulfide reductase [Xanthobacteraceae bacterium]|nr:TlpA family protein disulfide reductase [Xanthobacteraceae bacterium]QYK44785.1 MAG: TlpA family protein disulfide reductase [Xanthobacteraceae bacterium]HMN51294.1 TlpA disulfide reductase family protein [Xanthobacteraceae bacterium]